MGNAILRKHLKVVQITSRKETHARWNDTNVILVSVCLCFSTFFLLQRAYRVLLSVLHSHLSATVIELRSSAWPWIGALELTQHLCTPSIGSQPSWNINRRTYCAKAWLCNFITGEKATLLGLTITFERLVFHCGRRFPITESTTTYETDELLEIMHKQLARHIIF